MCATFLIGASPKSLHRLFGLPFEGPESDFKGKVYPQMNAPVVALKNNRPQISNMKFSLVPAWSKEPKVKFATYNARLSFQDKDGKDGWIYQKPTWREPFQKQHCLVPMSSFFESVNTGPLAGNMVRFEKDDHEILVAAAIYSQWVDKKSGEVIDSFAIITDEPDDFIKSNGHDRSPLFLPPSSFEKWLHADLHSATEWVSFLRAERIFPKLSVHKERALKGSPA